MKMYSECIVTNVLIFYREEVEKKLDTDLISFSLQAIEVDDGY